MSAYDLDRHRHRPRRLRVRHPREPARHEGRRRREAGDARRHLPQRRAASPRRRCCTPPSASRRRGTRFGGMGIEVKPKLDLDADDGLQGRGREGQRRRRRVPACGRTRSTTSTARAALLAAGKVEVTFINGEKQELETKAIVIATGSDVAQLPGIDIDEKTVVSSTGALSLAKVPKRLLVVGAGVIGLELGSVWRRLGAEVHGRRVPRPHPAGHGRRGGAADPEDPREAGHGVQARPQGDGRSPRPAAPEGDDRAGEGRRGGDDRGRRGARRHRPRAVHATGSGSPRPASRVDNRGRVIVDERYETSVPGIYAIGDVIAGPMLAHKAEDEGIAVAEILGGAGRARELRRDPQRRLHVPRGRERRQDRGGAEGARASTTASASSRSRPTAAPRPTRRPTAS